MTAQDTFDRRLGEALLVYAADAALEPDPMRFASEIAAAHPRSRLAALAGATGRPRLRLLWIATVLLLLAAAVGASLVGMRPPDRPSPLVVGPHVPDELYGRWVPDGNADRYLDLNSASVLHEADGRAVDWAGSVVGFLPAGQGAIEGRVLIHSSLPCGDASYRLEQDDTPSSGPTAAPAPSSSQPPTLIFLGPIRFVDAVDPCPARRSILAEHPWARLMLPLAAGGTYHSMDFPEPFHMTLPADVALGLPNGGPAGFMYETHRNQLRLSHAWWNAAFIDDVPVFRDLCKHDLGTLPDIPRTVDDVVAWLTSTTSLGFEPPAELLVDGRRAVRWQVRGECGQNIPAASDLAFGSEYYAIDTGDDVILFVVRADTPNESKVAERIVLAMHFD